MTERTAAGKLPTNWDAEPPRRIGVFRALKLGDMLVAVPALRALRAAFRGARITLIGLPWARAFVERYVAYLDDLLVLPGWPGLPERPVEPATVPPFLADAQARRFDLVLQIHGSGGISNPLAILLGGRTTAGFYQPGGWCPDPARFILYPEDEPERRRPLRLLEHLGIPLAGEQLEFPLSPADHADLAAALSHDEAVIFQGRYVCVHAGASVPERRWPPERFAQVADALAERGFEIVLTGGQEEAPIVAAVAQAMRSPALRIDGRTGLGALGALLSGASLLVSNDTGVMHVADALGVPSVAVAYQLAADRWAPADERRHAYLTGGQRVTVGQVLDAADAVLTTTRQ